MLAPHAPVQNHLLAALPRKDYQRLLARLEPVKLTFGEVLYEPGKTIRHVYFPGTSLVSLLTLADGHLALETGLLGRDGMVGIPLVLGHDESSVRALVQGTGTAMRMASAHFREEFRLSLPLQQELYGYTHTLMAQISQTAACNRFHVVETRLARWLLMTHDRDHQQSVNEPSHGVGGDESQGPQDDEHNGDGKEHGRSPLRKGRPRRDGRNRAPCFRSSSRRSIVDELMTSPVCMIR